MADTGFKDPTADAADVGGFTNPTDAYTSNTVYASVFTINNSHRYYNYNFGIPAGSTNFFIEVDVKAYSDGTIIVNGDGGRINIEISIDGGSSWSSGQLSTFNVGDGDSTFVLGGSTDNWGLTLTESSFSNANFRIRGTLTFLSGGATIIYIDWIPVKVFYTAGAVVSEIRYNPIFFAGD